MGGFESAYSLCLSSDEIVNLSMLLVSRGGGFLAWVCSIAEGKVSRKNCHKKRHGGDVIEGASLKYDVIMKLEAQVGLEGIV